MTDIPIAGRPSAEPSLVRVMGPWLLLLFVVGGMVLVALGGLVSAPLIESLFGVLGFRRTMALLALICLLPASPAQQPTVPWSTPAQLLDGLAAPTWLGHRCSLIRT